MTKMVGTAAEFERAMVPDRALSASLGRVPKPYTRTRSKLGKGNSLSCGSDRLADAGRRNLWNQTTTVSPIVVA